jgi:integrase
LTGSVRRSGCGWFRTRTNNQRAGRPGNTKAGDIMASISRDPGGRRRILFMGADGKRRAIRLGKVSQRVADSICAKVEALAAAAAAKLSWDSETAAWVGGLDCVLYDKLAAVDLVPKRETPEASAPALLGPFLDAYIAGRGHLKPSTKCNYEQTRRSLVTHFGANKALADITPGDADDWRQSLVNRPLAPPTIARDVKRARQFFQAAVRKRLLSENPFRDMKAGKQTNESRKVFVTRETTQAVLEACPDNEWRLLVALSRYGGLRCPSEHLSLRWDGIDWERDRMTVYSPKTEHHADGASRLVPIFPELRPYLEAAFDAAPDGAVYVIQRYRHKNANLRTQFERIIRRAGVEPWQKPFQNLRASRETELTAQFPLHVVCRWIGNSPAVAHAHYLQTTEADFQRAAQGGAESGALAAQNGAQNQAQRVSAVSRDDTQICGNSLRGKGLQRKSANPCQSSRVVSAPPVGLEPTTRRLTAACSTN